LDFLNKVLNGKTFTHKDGETCTIEFIAEYNNEPYPQDKDVLIMYRHPKLGQRAENFNSFLLNGVKIEDG
jgi:hypothetical protein